MFILLYQINLMKYNLKFFGYLFVLNIFLFSCASSKDVIYLQKDSINVEENMNNFQLTFKPDDLLQIIVTSKDLDAVLDFNLPVVSYSTNSNLVMNQPQLQNYLVNQEGFIDFPILGKIKVGGLTRTEVIKLLKEKLDPNYVKNPVINILITNFKISVHGDVRNPGIFNLTNERISIFDALGLAGDLNISGDRSEIRVLRENNNTKEIFSLDLRSKNIFSSPAYYLQQNDVVIVNPNSARIQDSKFTRSAGLFISLASVLISLVTIITR